MNMKVPDLKAHLFNVTQWDLIANCKLAVKGILTDFSLIFLCHQ